MTDYKMSFDATLSFNGKLDYRVTTVEQLLDQEPFSPDVREWLRQHTEVRDALKIIIRQRFVPTHAISIVKNPLLKGVKESIGIYSIDTHRGNQIKQDYLMHEDDDTFVLFTGLPRRIKPSQFVRHVDTLEKRYGPDGLNFFKDHHKNIEDVPKEIRPYIERAIKNVN
jgi:hypothetical protein